MCNHLWSPCVFVCSSIFLKFFYLSWIWIFFFLDFDVVGLEVQTVSQAIKCCQSPIYTAHRYNFTFFRSIDKSFRLISIIICTILAKLNHFHKCLFLNHKQVLIRGDFFFFIVVVVGFFFNITEAFFTPLRICFLFFCVLFNGKAAAPAF